MTARVAFDMVGIESLVRFGRDAGVESGGGGGLEEVRANVASVVLGTFFFSVWGARITRKKKRAAATLPKISQLCLEPV